MNYHLSCYQWHLLHSTTISTRTQINNALHAVSGKKKKLLVFTRVATGHYTIACNFAKWWSIFTILSLFWDWTIGSGAYWAGRAVACPLFLCPIGKHSCLPYHVSASKLIFFFHFILNTCRQWMQILLSILKPWQNSIFSWKSVVSFRSKAPRLPPRTLPLRAWPPSHHCCLPTLNDLLLPMSRQKTCN